MSKNNKQMKVFLLAILLLVSPILWLVLGNAPTSFDDKLSWIFVMTFAVLAYAIYLAFDSDHKK
jgi:hypothetical protein